MATLQPIPILLNLMTGIVLGLIAGELWRVHGRKGSDPHIETSEEMLFDLRVLASFGLGMFLGYGLLGKPFWARQP
jgi:hypothetical protein